MLYSVKRTQTEKMYNDTLYIQYACRSNKPNEILLLFLLSFIILLGQMCDRKAFILFEITWHTHKNRSIRQNRKHTNIGSKPKMKKVTSKSTCVLEWYDFYLPESYGFGFSCCTHTSINSANQFHQRPPAVVHQRKHRQTWNDRRKKNTNQ